MHATLYLIPTTLGDLNTISRTLPSYNLEVIYQLDTFVVEQIRTARRFLIKAKHPLPIDDMVFYELNKHTDEQLIGSYLNVAKAGRSIGLISEAGTPCVADPGAVVVKMAHELGIRVVPLVGPNSIILSLMASGFNGQSFVFHGYLPVDKTQLVKKIKEMEANARRLDQTQVFIETPYRNNSLLETLIQNCQPQTPISVATDLTLPTERIVTMPSAKWKKEKVDLHKRPTVFSLYR